MSRKAGKGSHGSLTKAGKVRSGTIKVERTSKQKKKMDQECKIAENTKTAFFLIGLVKKIWSG